MSDLLPKEQTTKHTYDTLAKTWAVQHDAKHFWAPEMQRFHELLPSGTILEIGAGGGRDGQELLALGYRYVGTDLSSGLLAVARKTLPNQELYEQSVYDLDFPDREKFDGFWTATLLHIPKSRIDEALQRIKTVIKPGGIGFISLKDGDDEQVRVDEFGGSKFERFFAYWRKDEFIETLKQNGYTLIDYTYHQDERKDRQPWHCFFVKL
jgi:SAM-dependent methyltransferase